MSKSSEIHVALLRGINVAGQRRIPMTELRTLVSSLGCDSVGTYIQSGNLVFRSPLSSVALEEAIEIAIYEKFGFEVETVTRTGARWLDYASESGFPHAEKSRPKTLLLCISKTGPAEGALTTVMSYAKNERAKLLGDALWIDFIDGSGRSKIRPAVLQRALGPSATTRNWRTVQALADMIRTLDNL